MVATPTLKPTRMPRSEPINAAIGAATRIAAEGEVLEAGDIPSILLTNGDGQWDDWRGIGRFVGLASCTATLLDSSANDQAAAYVITSGRCVQPWSANNVNLDLPADEMGVIFNYFSDTLNSQILIAVSRVAYSTMKGRDLAIVELDASLGDMKARGIQPFRVAKESPGFCT